MAVAVVAHIGFVGTTSGGSTTSSSINTTGATFLIAAHAHFGGSTFSDNKSNTWTLLRTGNNGSLTLDMYVAITPIVGSGHTFTVVAGFPSAYIIAMSGLYTVQDLDTGAPANLGTSVTSLATAAFTPKYDNSLIVTGLAKGAGGIPSPNGAFSATDALGGVGGTALGGGIAWQQQGTKASVTPTWTWTTAVNAVIECLVFTTPPSGGGSAGGSYPFVG